MESDSDSDHAEEKKSQRGPTIKSKAGKGKVIITYNKKGVPIGKGSVKLSTFEGLVARTMIPITYTTWRNVGKETKEELWQYVMAHFVVNPKSRKQTIQSIWTKWRNFKHTLYRDHIKTQKDDPEEKKNLLNPPPKYPFLEKEDLKLFVVQRTSKQWEETSKKAKKVRAHHKYNHHLSRKGYARLAAEIMQATGLEEEEIDMAMLWKRARELKTGGFDSDVQVVVDRIDKLQESDSEEVTCGAHDVLTQALGTDEQRGHVRGMGKFVTQQQYFNLPNTVKHYMDTEKKKYDKRLNKVEDELEKLKRGVNNVSEAGSCQWGNEDFEDNPDEEPLDMSCLLAVDHASNIVAKGTILMGTNEEEFLQVMLEICLHREALLPCPLKEEFIMEVVDAVGHILSWPRHLVIRCSDLEKMVAKPKTKPVKDLECKKQIKQPRGTDEENEREFEQKIVQVENVTGKEVVSEKEKKRKKEPEPQKEREDVQVNEGKRRMTRAQRRPRIRVENNAVLTMTATVVDAQVLKVDSIKLQCVDDLFGYESFTYLNQKDFEAIFTLDELTGSVITTYMMLLYEQIKNGPKHDHGICFVSPSAISPSERKSKPKHIDDASRMVADWLSTRKDNDIILVPYNPGRHWVLAVLDMKTNTCYYLNSIRNSIINPVLRQIIDAAMALYAVQSGTKTRVKVNWVNAKCPYQTGCTECGYYVLKFMKEVVEEGIEILANDNVGRGGKVVYTDEDIDGIREGCLSYGVAFVFK